MPFSKKDLDNSAAENRPAAEELGAAAAPRRRRWPFRLAKYFFLSVCAVIIAASGAAIWTLNSGSGRAWLEKTINSALAPSADGLGFRVSGIEGSIPFNFSFALEGLDRRGVWLTAPRNKFFWDWRALPGSIRLIEISMKDPVVQRLPDLPPQTEEKTSPAPVDIKAVQAFLASVSDFLAQKRWWLPELNFDNIALQNALLPPGILGEETAPALRADAGLRFSFIDSIASLALNGELKSANGDPVTARSIVFQSARLKLDARGAPREGGLTAGASLEIAADRPRLELKDIPPDCLGDAARLSLSLSAEALTAANDQRLNISISGPTLEAGSLALASSGKWQSDERWNNGQAGGTFELSSSLSLSPPQSAADSTLAFLRAPVLLSVRTQGTFPRADMSVDLSCDELERSGFRISGARLALAGKDIEIPYDSSSMQTLENENCLDLSLSGLFEKEKISLGAKIFFQALADKFSESAAQTASRQSPKIWRFGARDLDLSAFGLTGSGAVAALVRPGAAPRFDGTVNLQIGDWRAVSMFAPDYAPAGRINLVATLASGLAEPFNDPSRQADSGVLEVVSGLPQTVNLSLDCPRLTLRSLSDGKTFALQGLSSEILLSDLFARPAINGSVRISSFAGMGLSGNFEASASGPFAGPLEAQVSGSGSVNAKIAAVWNPGRLELKKLDLLADLRGFLPKDAKKGRAGVRAARPAFIEYGEAGIRTRNLDLKILPSGSLRASGDLAPDKLDFTLDLKNLDFKPWQAIFPQLPAGRASLAAALKGSPASPGGSFDLILADLAVPGVPLPPLGLKLKGGIEGKGTRCALTARLEMTPATIKALGCEKALVNAKIPLLFETNGLPRPNENGQLAASLRWDGTIAPLWNLAPLSGARLNGRLGIDLNADGKLASPRIKGDIRLNGAQFEDLLLGIFLTNINMTATLAAGTPKTGGEKKAAEFSHGEARLILDASDGRGGVVNVSGSGGLNGENLDVKAKIDHLRPLRRRDIHIELSGQAAARGSALAPDIAGEITINQGEILLNNISVSGGVTTLDISNPPPKTSQAARVEAKKATRTAPAGKTGTISVRVVMLPRFVVEGRGLTSVWRANLLIAGSLNDPLITGNISAVKGNFDFLGKNFALSRGVVFFGGGEISNPLIDMDLTNETPDMTAHILLSGPVSKMKLTINSNPAMPRDEIISRVLFGRSVNDLSRMEALQLAAGVAQLAGFGGGSGFLGSAKKALGVDVLRLGTSSAGAAGQPGEQSAAGTTVEMGKYLNDWLYVGVQQGLQSDSSAFIIQLELTPRTSLEMRTERNNTWGGLKWKYNY